MHIIYTTQRTGFKGGFAYRNPRYFAGVENGATAVTVVGDWPDVVNAYAKVGIEVKTDQDHPKGEKHADVTSGDGNAGTADKTSDDTKADNEAPKRLIVPEIKEALAAKGVEIPAGVTKRDDLLALLEAAE